MTAKSENILKNDISNAIANNNSGDITAEDVRESMKDIVDSIPLIISEADMNVQYGFEKNVRAKRDEVNNLYGVFIAESGMQFVLDNNNIQTVHFPGVENLDHGQLEPNSLLDDDHLQYLNLNGVRPMEGNLGLDNYWLNSEGGINSNDRGVQFSHDATSDVETVHVGSKTIVEFDDDASRIDTSKGVAKAWVSFDAHQLSDSSPGNIIINSSFNISDIQTTGDGKFVIYFKNNIPVPYVAIGSSNSTTDNSAAVDFDLNTVGIVERAANYLTFVIRNDNGEYVNAKVNDLVVFGLSHADEVAEETTPQPQLP